MADMTWGNMSDGIPTGMVVTALSFNAASRQLAASTYGRGVYMLNVGQSVRPHPGRVQLRVRGHNFQGMYAQFNLDNSKLAG